MSSNETSERLAYSASEVADLLGVSRQHVYRLIRRREIKSVLVGDAVRIPRAELERLAGSGDGQ